MNASGPCAPLVGVGVVARDERGRILLGERTKATEPRSWCLPGGRLEAGEGFEEAGLRELEEETGIRAATARAFCLHVHRDAPAPWLTAGVLVDVHGDPAPKVTEPHNFASWGWFAADSLPEPLFPPTRGLMDVLRGARPDPAWAPYSLSPSAAVEDPPTVTHLEAT